MNYTGVIIEESLENKDILKKLKVVSTEVELVTESMGTPWLKQWTLHTIEIPENQIDTVASEVAKALEQRDSWYADFKNDACHYIIFRDKTFKIDRSNPAEYEAVTEYGVSLGIPKHQVTFVS